LGLQCAKLNFFFVIIKATTTPGEQGQGEQKERQGLPCKNFDTGI
jgi:hypothetical protein